MLPLIIGKLMQALFSEGFAKTPGDVQVCIAPGVHHPGNNAHPAQPKMTLHHCHTLFDKKGAVVNLLCSWCSGASACGNDVSATLIPNLLQKA